MASNWELPTYVIAGGKKWHITNDCDFKVVLDVIECLNNEDLTHQYRIVYSLLIFYDELTRDNLYNCTCLEDLCKGMVKIINYGEEDESQQPQQRIMDWSHDYLVVTPAISRVLGYDVRTPSKYTHWYTFIGGYMEIGECTFSTIVSIRTKRQKNQKLEKGELDYYREHRKQIELPQKISREEQLLLDEPW